MALRRLVLAVLIMKYPATKLLHSYALLSAETTGFEIAISSIEEGKDVALDAHIFGPRLCM